MSFIYNGGIYNVTIDPTYTSAYNGIILKRGDAAQFPNNIVEVQ